VRTTVRIDDHLMAELKQRALQEKVSFTRLVNRILSQGLRASRRGEPARRRFRQRVFSMGKPAVDLTKALAMAAALEDEEVLRKLSLRK
jgi:hypothetical protein